MHAGGEYVLTYVHPRNGLSARWRKLHSRGHSESLPAKVVIKKRTLSKMATASSSL